MATHSNYPVLVIYKGIQYLYNYGFRYNLWKYTQFE